MDAVRAYATLGEIISVMKEVFGVYEESTVIMNAVGADLVSARKHVSARSGPK